MPRQWRSVMTAIDARRWGALLAADQLRAARAAGYAFVGFTEGDAQFAPTFKVVLLLLSSGGSEMIIRLLSLVRRIVYSSR